jgi:NAD(P)-dependent dehydrogenase (short-subunit alcohol dehydrogenase family)
MTDERTDGEGVGMVSAGCLADRGAIVTGAARRIGAAVPTAFVAQGARVVVADVLDAEGKELAHSLGRALQAPVLRVWAGDGSRGDAARGALLHRAARNGAARRGTYSREMEQPVALEA